MKKVETKRGKNGVKQVRDYRGRWIKGMGSAAEELDLAELRRKKAKRQVKTTRVSKHGHIGQAGYKLLHPGVKVSNASEKNKDVLRWDLNTSYKGDKVDDDYTSKFEGSKQAYHYRVVKGVDGNNPDKYVVVRQAPGAAGIVGSVDTPEEGAQMAQADYNNMTGASALSVVEMNEIMDKNPNLTAAGLANMSGVSTKRPGPSLGSDLVNVAKDPYDDSEGTPRFFLRPKSGFLEGLTATLAVAPAGYGDTRLQGRMSFKSKLMEFQIPATEIEKPTTDDMVRHAVKMLDGMVRRSDEAGQFVDQFGVPEKFGDLKVTPKYNRLGAYDVRSSVPGTANYFSLNVDDDPDAEIRNIDVRWPMSVSIKADGTERETYFTNLDDAVAEMQSAEEVLQEQFRRDWTVKDSKRKVTFEGDGLLIGDSDNPEENVQVISIENAYGDDRYGIRVPSDKDDAAAYTQFPDSYANYPTLQIAADAANSWLDDTSNPNSIVWKAPTSDYYSDNDEGEIVPRYSRQFRYEPKSGVDGVGSGFAIYPQKDGTFDLEAPNLNHFNGFAKVNTYNSLDEAKAGANAYKFMAITMNEDMKFRDVESVTLDKNNEPQTYKINGAGTLGPWGDPADGNFAWVSMNGPQWEGPGGAITEVDSLDDGLKLMRDLVKEFTPTTHDESWHLGPVDGGRTVGAKRFIKRDTDGTEYYLRQRDPLAPGSGWLLTDSNHEAIDMTFDGNFPQGFSPKSAQEAVIAANYYIGEMGEKKRVEMETWREAVSTVRMPDKVDGQFADVGRTDPALAAYGSPVYEEPMKFLREFDNNDLELHRGNIKEKLVTRVGEIFAEEIEKDPLAKAQYNRMFGEPDMSYPEPYQDGVNTLVGMWAGTSGDSDNRAVALQLRAVEVFGMPEDQSDGLMQETVRSARDVTIPRESAVLDAFLRAVYRNTQAELIARGVPEQVLLYRGMTFSPSTAPEWVKRGAVQGKKRRLNNTIMNPLTSWSADRETSNGGFAGNGQGDYSVLLTAIIPRSAIYATARTGQGCANEYEYIVAGGRGTTYADINGDQTLRPPGTFSDDDVDAYGDFYAEFGRVPEYDELDKFMAERGMEFSKPYFPKYQTSREQYEDNRTMILDQINYTASPEESYELTQQVKALTLSQLAEYRDFQMDYPELRFTDSMKYAENYRDYWALKKIGLDDLAEQMPSYSRYVPPAPDEPERMRMDYRFEDFNYSQDAFLQTFTQEFPSEAARLSLLDIQDIFALMDDYRHLSMIRALDMFNDIANGQNIADVEAKYEIN